MSTTILPQQPRRSIRMSSVLLGLLLHPWGLATRGRSAIATLKWVAAHLGLSAQETRHPFLAGLAMAVAVAWELHVYVAAHWQWQIHVRNLQDRVLRRRSGA